MSFKQPGPWLFALGTIGLGLAALQLLWLPDAPSEPGLWLAAPIWQIAAGLGLLFRRTAVIAAGALVLYWPAWLALQHLPALVRDPDQFSSWVSVSQALTFAAVALASAFARPGLWRAARMMLGLMVILFGGVHALHPEIVAGLLPDWFPLPGVWPYVTGALQIALGLMVLAGFQTRVAAFALGLVWLSWIPLVHLVRLIAAPGDPFEWTFMLTALTLAGAAWTVGERIAAASGEDFQPSVR